MEKNKQFIYYNYKFNISVSITDRLELAHVNTLTGNMSEPIFTIIVNDMGPGVYYRKYEGLTEQLLENTIKNATDDAKIYVDYQLKKIKPSYEKKIEDLGFK